MEMMIIAIFPGDVDDLISFGFAASAGVVLVLAGGGTRDGSKSGGGIGGLHSDPRGFPHNPLLPAN